MSQFNEEKIKHLSKLCRIAIPEEELSVMAKHLEQVVHYIEQLKEVDLSDLTPYSHLETQTMAHLREDEVDNTLSRTLFLANAPDSIGGMIRIPPVIKNI